MADHDYSITTGLTVQSTFSDSRVAKYLNLITNDLANKKYYKAFSTLLGYFRDNYNPSNPSPSPSSGGDSKITTPMVIGFCAVVAVVFVLIFFCNCSSSSSSSSTDSATYDYPNAPLYSDNYNTGLVNTNPVYVNPQPVIHVHHHSPPKHHHHPPPHHHHPPPKPKPKPAPKPKGAKAHGGGASGGW